MGYSESSCFEGVGCPGVGEGWVGGWVGAGGGDGFSFPSWASRSSAPPGRGRQGPTTTSWTAARPGSRPSPQRAAVLAGSGPAGRRAGLLGRPDRVVCPAPGPAEASSSPTIHRPPDWVLDSLQA